MDKEKILQKVRSVSNNMSQAIINNKVVVDSVNLTASFKIITDRVFSEQDKHLTELALKECLPERFTPVVTIERLAPDLDLFKTKLKQIIKNEFPSIDACLSQDNLKVEKNENEFAFTFQVDELEKSFFIERNVVDEVIKILKNNLCGEFKGRLEVVEKESYQCQEEPEDDVLETEKVNVFQPRTFKVQNFVSIDSDETCGFATCLYDCKNPCEQLTVCGRITFIQERESKAGKKYLTLNINDGTDTMKVSYFYKTKTIEKIKLLKEGESIVCTGRNELFNGYMSYNAKFINYGDVPDDFSLPKRKAVPPPTKYSRIFPEPYKCYTQNSLFEAPVVPLVLKGETFVVFDVETTGLNTNPELGNMDTLTEIGAVKIVDGEITEKFSTLINPRRKLTAENIKITGITDDMLKDAPFLEDVMPDFYKFCYESHLVAHNASFDTKFLAVYGDQLGYIFENKIYDTLAISHRKLKLPNYKLNTIADYYKIEFEHHRAFNDALATAKIFLEFMRDEKMLPPSMN